MSAIVVLTDRHAYYLYNGATDMRKSIDGLCGIVVNELGKEPNNRDIFIFLNKRGTHIKLLLREDDDFTLADTFFKNRKWRKKLSCILVMY